MKNTALFQEQYPSGVTIPTATPTSLNDRVLNTPVVNNIPGCTFDPATGYVTLNAPGIYLLEANSATWGSSTAQTQVLNVGGAVIAIGVSAQCTVGGQASQSTHTSALKGYLRVDTPVSIKLATYYGLALPSVTPTFCPVAGSAIDVGSQMLITQL